MSTLRGTTAVSRSMTRTTGIATAPSPAASTIRCRSGRLAKRHRPRYKPNARKMPACKGKIQASVCHVSESCGSYRSMFERSQYTPTQASVAAHKSCTNASQTRQLALTFFKSYSSPAPMILDRRKDQGQDGCPDCNGHDPCARSPEEGRHGAPSGSEH